MNGPTLHHRALGIHPGAFVQPAAPDTSDVQDGVLWVDTSTAEPYALSCWDAGARRWRLIGSVGVGGATSAVDLAGNVATLCLVFSPYGASICNDVPGVVHVTTPGAQHALDSAGYGLPGGHRLQRLYRLDAPTTPVSVSVPYAGGTAVVAVQVTYTWAAAESVHGARATAGESQPAPPGTASMPPGQSIDFIDWSWDVAPPDDALAVNVYLREGTGDPASPSWGPWWFIRSFNPWTAADLPESESAYVPSALGSPAGHGYVEEDPPSGAAPAEWLQERHSSGDSYIQQNGARVEVRAGDLDVLHLPLPVLTGAPARYVGIDALSGLPASAPLPPPPAPPQLTAAPLAPPAAPLSTCTQVRCGVAWACVGHLSSLYSQWANLINGALGALGGAVTAAALYLLLDPVTIAISAVVWSFLRSSIAGIASSVLASGCGGLTDDQIGTLRKALFCVLTCTGDVCTVDAAALQAWSNRLIMQGWPGLDQLQAIVLNALILYTPAPEFQAKAAVSSALTDCDGWTCA